MVIIKEKNDISAKKKRFFFHCNIKVVYLQSKNREHNIHLINYLT